MKIKKLVTSLVLGVSLASPIVAFAANVGGGTWNYGIGWTNFWLFKLSSCNQISWFCH